MSKTYVFPGSSLSPLEKMIHFPVGTRFRDCFDGWCVIDSELCLNGDDENVSGYSETTGETVQYVMGYCMEIEYPTAPPSDPVAHAGEPCYPDNVAQEK